MTETERDPRANRTMAQPRSRPTLRRRLVRLGAGIGSLAVGALSGLLLFTPDPEKLLAAAPRPCLEVVDRRGELLRLAPDANGIRYRPVDPERVSPYLRSAVLAAEDHRFYLHPGVDPVAVLRAAVQDVEAHRIVSGGSTLTMQLARILDPRPRGVTSKIAQVLLALRLEMALTKTRILAEYMARVPMGNRVVGMEAASRVYFNKPASQLSPAEAALLASVPRSPSLANPWKRSDRLKRRAAEVLRRMRARGALDEPSYRAAFAERPVLAKDPLRTEARAFLARALDSVRIPAGAVELETTLDLAFQRQVERLARAHVAELAPQGVHHMAVVVLDVERGEWIAMEGSGIDERLPGGSIDGTRVPRQPGSALKPFTYATAFERGTTPATILPDIPRAFPWSTGTWVPRNYDERFHGPLRARQALACSVNVPAATLLASIGPESLLETLHRAGLTTLNRSAETYGLGLTLGAGEVRLDELTLAYAALLRGGEWRGGTLWRSARDDEGRIVARPEPPQPRRVCSKESAAQVVDILADPEARSAAFGAWSVLRLPFPAAVKTGTSESFRDNWCIGGNERVVVGVWCGNFSRAPMGNISGVSGAGALWREVMLAWAERTRYGLEVGSELSHDAPPRGMIRSPVCALSGLVPTSVCPLTVLELFRPDQEPRARCDWHVLGPDGRAAIVYPPLYRDWAAHEGRLEALGGEGRGGPAASARNSSITTGESSAIAAEGRTLPGNDASGPMPAPVELQDSRVGPRARGTSPERGSALARIDPTRGAPIAVVSPTHGDSFLIAPDIPRRYQTLELRCSVSGNPDSMTWVMDGEEIAHVAYPYSLSWPLEAGAHRFQAVVGSVRSKPVVIMVHGQADPAPARSTSIRSSDGLASEGVRE